MDIIQKNQIFRRKSLDTISSPEQLTSYLRVTTPGIWTVLTAVILLLAGLFAWSAAGNLETTADAVAVVNDGVAAIMVSDSGKDTVRSGMELRIGSENSTISSVEQDEFGRTVAYAPVSVADGRYDVKIVTESIHPIRFLFD